MFIDRRGSERKRVGEGERSGRKIISTQKTDANAKGRRIAFPVNRMEIGPGSVFAGEITSA